MESLLEQLLKLKTPAQLLKLANKPVSKKSAEKKPNLFIPETIDILGVKRKINPVKTEFFPIKQIPIIDTEEEIKQIKKLRNFRFINNSNGFKRVPKIGNVNRFKSGKQIIYENPTNTNLYKMLGAIRHFLLEDADPIFPANKRKVRIFFTFNESEIKKTSFVQNMNQKQIDELLLVDNPEKLILFMDRFFNKTIISEGSGSDFNYENTDVNVTIFEIFRPKIPTNITGGARLTPTEKKNKNLKNAIYYTRFICLESNQKNADSNDCLIRCFKSKGTKNLSKQMGTVRKDLKLGNGLCAISDIPKLEQFYGIQAKCVTYNQIENEIITLYGRDNFIADEGLLILYFKDEIAPKGHFCIVEAILDDDLYAKATEEEDEKKYKKRRYIGLDYETIATLSTYLSPYCLYVLIMEEDGTILDRLFAPGFGCQDGLKRFLTRWDDPDYDNIIVGFNSSRFDNFFLLEAATGWGWMERSSIFYVKNSILDLKFKSFRCFDLCRYVMTSLEQALKDFKCKNQKIEFKDEHIRIQRIFYEKGVQGIETYLKENYNKIVDYNAADVVGMMELFFKVKKTLEGTSAKILDGCTKTVKGKLASGTVPYKPLIVEDFMTLSSYAYEHLVILEHPISNYDLETSILIKNSQYGGRSQINRRGFFTAEEFDKFCSLDVISLYPFVMKTCLFPKGDYTKTDEYVPGKLGIYNCIILSQNENLNNVIPSRTKTKPLDWNYKGVISTPLNSVDIEDIIKHGGKVEIQSGIYWEESDYIFKKIISIPEAAKNEQDRLAREEPEKYNGAVRNMNKFFMNAIGGKTGQNNYNTATEIITNTLKQTAFMNKYNDAETFPMSFNCTIMKGTKKEDTKIKYKPWHLMSFIFGYARSHMFNSILCKVPKLWFATDTDSCHILKSELLKLEDYGKSEFGQFHIGSNFGDFDDELKKNNFQRAYYERPKCYAYFEDPCENFPQGGMKMRFKGISKRDRLADFEQFGYDKNSGICQREWFDSLPIERKFEIHNESKPALNEELYKRMIEKEDIMIISSRLEKSLGGVMQKYQLKVASTNEEAVV